MIAWWPGRIRAGTENDHISAFWDFLPTFAELSGQPVPAGLDGVSFLPTLLGKEQPKHDFLYWEFHEGRSKQAIRMGKWKAVRPALSQPLELYNLTSDIGEKNNIAAAHPEIIEKIEKTFSGVRTNAASWPLQ
jgi:arylsulfatase A-like enzyme